MSLARHFLREFRPLFRMLEEPFMRSPLQPARSFLEDPLFSVSAVARPAIDITEQAGAYVVEADLPGVKKENVEIRIEDGGRSVTIAGKVVSQRTGTPSEATVEQSPEGASAEGSTTAVKRDESSNQLSSERYFTGSSTFSRTIWLPRPVDGSNVSAKLKDGILTLTIPKTEDKASIKVDVE